MRVLTAVVVTIFMLPYLAACGTNTHTLRSKEDKKAEVFEPANKKTKEAVNEDNKKSSQPVEEKKTEKPQESIENKNSGEARESESKPAKGAELIIKSENTVSSQYKEAILKQLDDELNDLFRDIDQMDELKDGDFDFQ